MVTDTWMTTLSTPDALDNNDTYDYFSEWCAYTNPQLSISSYFTLVFTILGLIANGCLLFVILRRRYLRNLTNMLVVNLAASDILLFVTTTPFFVEADIHPCWQFGTTGCKFTNMIWVVLHSVCMFTLAALAVERYCAVTSRAGFRSKTCALGSIWLFAALLALPVLITAHMPYEGVCMGFANDVGYIQGYITFHVFVTYVFPLTTIGYFYIRMARNLLKNNSTSTEMDKAGNKDYRKRRRLAAIVLVLVLIFAVFWAPFHAVNLTIVYRGFENISWHIRYILLVLHYVLIYLYLCLNPVVIFMMSSSLRRELISCSRGDHRRKHELVSEGSPSDVSDLELQQPMNKEQEANVVLDLQQSIENEQKEPLRIDESWNVQQSIENEQKEPLSKDWWMLKCAAIDWKQKEPLSKDWWKLMCSNRLKTNRKNRCLKIDEC